MRLIAVNCLWAFIALPVLSSATWAGDQRPPAVSTEDRSQSEQVARLIQQLGAQSFAVRQRAQRELIAAGRAAKDVLAIACDSPDAEVRQRARQALAEVLDADFQVRLDAFLADDTGPEGHDLPGWERFRALAGDGPLARRLFGDMQRAERELLEAAETDPKRAGDVLESRCAQVGQNLSELAAGSNRPNAVPSATLAALLLVAANEQVPISLQAGGNLYQFCRGRTLEQAMLARNTGDILRRMLVAWVTRRFSSDSMIAYWNIALGMDNEIKESLTPAIAVLSAGGVPAHWAPWAILAVGKFGGPEQTALLEPLLNDSRSIAVPNRGRQELDAQVRDVALAVLVHLSGQQLADYGFSQARRHTSCLFVADSLGFNDPEARDRALKKWREREQGRENRE